MTVEAAYFAGILDGEGSITVRVLKPRSEQSAPNVVPRVAVAMTHRPTLDALAERYGGTVILRSAAERTTHRRPVFVWEARGHGLAKCLCDVLPYLRIKRTQAEAALALYERRQTPMRPGSVTGEELAARMALAETVREANRAR